MVSDQWLTVAQAADILQVHPETLREWLRGGRIPATLLSRRAGYRIRAGDLEAFLSGEARGYWGKEKAAA
jgi:excisionase family DNA binding protein